MDEISKKDLLIETGISYGQLYRWKREGLIPEEWFVKRSSFTGQETFFPRERILERVGLILERKDDQSLEEIRREITGTYGGELDWLIDEALASSEPEETPCSAILFETNDGKHFILSVKGGKGIADKGTKVISVLTEKEIRDRIRSKINNEEYGGK